MPKTFRPGRRLQRLQYFAYLLFSAEIFIFYLIYRYLLEQSYPQYAGAFLLIVFILIETAAMLITKRVFKKLEEKLTCTVDKNGVTVTNLIGTVTMPWEKFEAAYIPVVAGRHPCPVCFTVGGKRFLPNRYYADIAVLDTMIVDRIRDHAEIGKNVEKSLESYRDMDI